MRFLWVLIAMLPAAAVAQDLTTMASGTITAGGTFQLVFTGRCPNAVQDPVGCPLPPPPTRNGCTVQNVGTHNIFVWNNPNPAVNATDAKSWLLAPGSTFNCQLISGKVIVDPIYIDGTTADIFAAGQQ